jgi:hypothetical protein
MEELLITLAQKYGMEKAMELLGLEQEAENELVYGMPLESKGFNLESMLARTGINSLMKGGSFSAAPFIGGLGLAYYRNPLREGAPNYNPNLRGQMEYLSSRNMLGTDQSGLTKIMSGPLRGKNLVSMFGTNDYEKMLDKKIGYFQARKDKGKSYSHDKYMKALDEKEQVTKDIGDGVSDNTGGDPGSAGASDQFSNRSGRGRTGYGRGGIASL